MGRCTRRGVVGSLVGSAASVWATLVAGGEVRVRVVSVSCGPGCAISASSSGMSNWSRSEASASSCFASAGTVTTGGIGDDARLSRDELLARSAAAWARAVRGDDVGSGRCVRVRRARRTSTSSGMVGVQSVRLDMIEV